MEDSGKVGKPKGCFTGTSVQRQLGDWEYPHWCKGEEKTMSWLFIGWWTTGQFVLLTYRTWAIYDEVWMGYSVYLWNGVHLKRGCENLTSVVR